MDVVPIQDPAAPPAPLKTPLPLGQLVVPVSVTPGGEVILRGSYTSTRDGSVVDAATTTWPSGAPGGASVDSGGLIDFEAGGFTVLARDPVTHVVKLVANDAAAPACVQATGAEHCLVMRTTSQAQSRLMTRAEWVSSLKGSVQVEVVAPPVVTPLAAATSRHGGALAGGLGALAAVAVGYFVLRARKRAAASPRGQLLALAKRVQAKVAAASPVLAAPLEPVLASALEAVRDRRIDPGSSRGAKIARALREVEARVDEAEGETRAQAESEVAGDLVRDMEAALAAIDETLVLSGEPKRRVAAREPATSEERDEHEAMAEHEARVAAKAAVAKKLRTGA